ncbi:MULTISPECIES: hypothetical protein [Acinetobacter]|uniref:Lipoprotein n=1 Tax=Acinetobacter lwoffii TaxID=28090 RepID=A0A6N1MWP4_ACILW|nr:MULTISPECIES: hypothetical protein [Acinetobacter]ENX28979.1 hypothetical protein F891_00896 [Acinetobacter sp. CIP 101966]QKU22157.1 hypothetical protein FOB19_12575 [Acinetobacter lwoffii]
MKNLSLFFFIMILAGCGHGESIGQHLDLETIKKEQLEFAKEATKEFIPNPDSAKFRNQIGECGEVSYKEADGTDIGFQRFIVLQKNIVLVENQTDQKQFELSWKSACTPSWNK